MRRCLDSTGLCRRAERRNGIYCGSHLWSKKYAPNILFAQSIHPFSPFEKLEDIEANRECYDIVSFDVEPGDVLIHDVMTIHGSRGNISKDRMRRAMSFRYCGDDITYLDRPGALEQPYLEIRLNDGDPLYWSEDYPLVWTETEAANNFSSYRDKKLSSRMVNKNSNFW
jgi:ectoine hydroxylase-related dioxygenase (phytanoyl-CoA dioxygenase family)